MAVHVNVQTVCDVISIRIAVFALPFTEVKLREDYALSKCFSLITVMPYKVEIPGLGTSSRTENINTDNT